MFERGKSSKRNAPRCYIVGTGRQTDISTHTDSGTDKVICRGGRFANKKKGGKLIYNCLYKSVPVGFILV